MAKVKQPLLSLDARRKLGDDIVFTRRRGRSIAEKHPEPQDARSLAQLSWRHMFLKVVALWHALSAAEKEAWESLGRKRHMTGYAWFVSQALRPNPGIYLPLQGGIMQGIIDMDGFAIQDLLDPVNPQDADTEAARDAAIATALEDCIDSHIHGWDGADWQKLKVESAAQHNLRVRLYDGAVGIGTIAGTGDITTQTHLIVTGGVQAKFGVNDQRLCAGYAGNADGRTGAQYGLNVACWLYGYNGVTFDRLRSWGTGILKVGRAEIGLSTMRRVAVGAVKAAAGQLYWMLLNPSAGNSAVELTDALAGGGAIVTDHFDTARDGHMITFDPPFEFSTGIYLETFTNMTSVTFGYK